MSIIVQRAAFDIVCGLERNFLMPEQQRKSFAVRVLKDILVEQGLRLDDRQLRHEIKWAD